MKKLTLLFTLFFLVSITSFSQTSPIEWQKSLGGSSFDYAYSIIQTTDDGYIVAGYSNSNNGDVSGNHGNSDYWVLKLDASGNIQWQKTLGGSNDDRANSIVQTTDGGYVVAGYSNSNDDDVSGNHGNNDYWIVKLDASGNIQWQKSLGGSDFDYAYSIVQTTDGGYIVVGYSESNDGDVNGNHGNSDYWVVKLDTLGNIQWQKSLGGSGFDYAYSIVQTTNGGYIVAGSSNSNDGDISGNHGGPDYWIVKLDASGNIQWQKSLGGSGFDYAYSIVQTTDGGYIVVGHSESNDGDVNGNHGNDDYWIVKLNTSGNITGQNSLGGTYDDEAFSIVQTADGKYVVAGFSRSNNYDVSGNHGNYDYWIVKLKDYWLLSTKTCIGDSTGTATVVWWGTTTPSYYWSNGDTAATADSLAWGWYYITITAGGNTIVDSVFVEQNDSIYIYFSKNNPSCFGYDNGEITAYISGGTSPYSYLWSNGMTTYHMDSLTAGTYILTVTDNLGCQLTDSITLIEPPMLQDSIVFTQPSHCYDVCNGSATVYPYGGTPSYTLEWSNGDTTQTIVQLCSNTNYTVTITDADGCSVVDSITYPVFKDSLQICVVTIDTVTGKCLVVWERPDVQILNGFAIYKKTGATTYSEIGNTSWEDMTEFLDSASMPEAFAHTYKICMIDTCGNYTPLSYYHKTMYLTANQGANQNEVALHWTHYEDESGNFQPETYSIYRKCIPTHPNYELIATIPGDLTDFNDINPPAGDLFYLVITPHDDCIPTSIDKDNGGISNSSISNIDNYIVQNTNSARVFLPVSLYPNPVKDKLTIEIYNPQGQVYSVRLVNAAGKVVYETDTKSSKIEIDRGKLPGGVYEVIITGGNQVYSRKVIVD